MKKQKTIYHLIVDKSGSMYDCIEKTITGFNEQVKRILAMEKEFVEQEMTIGLTTFNDEICHHYFQEPPGKVRKLNTDTYRPSGSTALLDAIGITSRRIESEFFTNDVTVVVVILTDGYENSSKTYKLEDIKALVSRLICKSKFGINCQTLCRGISIKRNLERISATYLMNK
jgi:hypothetical protein